ncbi:hypothetical protein [Sphingomonas parapaucimobilis]|uniref:hypothetical protein n=1 Tax=Sphingomonas parapaucimobilis TaxID=28213 RepID=UPI00391CC36E
MSVVVRLPNGQEIEVDTDDEAAAASAGRAYWGALSEEERSAPPARQEPSAPAKPRTALQTAGDFLGDTIDNVLPNWGDEVAAIPDAAKALFKGQDVGEAFDKGRQEFKANQAQYDEEHPWLAWGSTLTGLGASLALPAGRLASGAGMAAKVAQGAAVGAGYGAVGGLGAGDSVSQRANNAAAGAVFGAAMGGGASPLIAGASSVAKKLGQFVPGADFVTRKLPNVPRAVMRRQLRTKEDVARDQAFSLLNKKMGEGDIATGFGRTGARSTPQAVFDEVTSRQAMNVPAMLGDVSEPMRAVTSWASRGAGPGQTLVRNALDARKATEANRVRQHLTETLGPTTDYLAQAEAHSARARREAAPMYAEAYAQPMVLTPEMRGIIQTPAFQDAVPHAVRNIRNAQRNPEAMGFVMRNDGSLDPKAYQYLSTEGFDQVIRAMRDNGRAAAHIDPLTGRVINNTNSVHINARAADLRNELASQNGAYRDATGTYADEMALKDALLSGADVTKLSGSELRQVAASLPANAREAWSIGARSRLADDASTYGANFETGSTARHIRKALGDEQKQAALSDMFGPEADIRSLQSRLEAEHQGNILWSEVQGNSKTAQRQQVDKDMEATLGLPLPSSFGWRGLVGMAGNALQAAGIGNARQGIKDQVAQAVTEQNPDRLANIMEGLRAQAQREAAAGVSMHRGAVLAAKAAPRLNSVPEPGMFSSDGTRWHRGADGMMYNDDETFGYEPN